MEYKSYLRNKETGVDWIKEVPEEWEVRKIKNIAKIFSGTDKKGDGDCPIYGANGIIGFCENPSFKKEKVIIGRVGSSGEVNLAQENYGVSDNALVVNNNESTSSTKYLFYILKCLDLTDEISINAQPLITSTKVKENIIPYPLISEQYIIANFLDKKIAQIDKLIKKDKKLIELLQERRIALINHVVTKGLNPNARMKDSGIKWIGKIPEDWEVCKLKNRVEERKIKNNFKEKNDTIFIGLENIEGETGKLLSTSTTENIDGESYTFKKNNVLFGKLRPYLAKVLKVNFDGTCTGELIIFSSIRGTDPKYLFYRLISKSFIKLVDSMTYGVKMPRVSPYEIGSMKIGWPSLIEQKKIANYLDEKTSNIDFTIKKIQQKINFLEEYKKSLIHHVVTGKVDVRSVKV